MTVKGNHVQLSCAVKGRIRGDVAWSADGLAVKSGLLYGIRSVVSVNLRLPLAGTHLIAGMQASRAMHVLTDCFLDDLACCR